MTTTGRLVIDEPVPHVRRLTLDRPEKRALKERDTPFGDYRGREGAGA